MASENEHDSKLWEQRHQELTQWQAKYGNCNVPKAEGKLGRWVVRQRELHKKGKLESERQRKLNSLGFVWNTNEAAWEHKYALLLDYYRRKGTCCVPISDSTLGMWVAKMRANRRRNKLSKHRIDKLDAINFVWNTAEADWMDKYNRLLEYRNHKGDSCVPFNEGELGWWVNTQRQNKRKGKLVPHREALLDKADFVWNPQEFLAARRRHHAALRASNAHAIASNDQYYRQALNTQHSHRLAPNIHQSVSQLQYEGVTSTGAENPRKRRHVPPTFYSNESAIGECEVSPTSVKRPKFTVSPITPSTHVASWPIYPTSSATLSQGTPTAISDMKQESATTGVWGASFYHPNASSSKTTTPSSIIESNVGSDNGSQAVPRATSIAALLSPIQTNSLSRSEKVMDEKWKNLNKSETSGLEVLSSVCAVSSQSLNSSPKVKLPPISVLSPYERQETGVDRS